jgi:hypothetical protein
MTSKEKEGVIGSGLSSTSNRISSSFKENISIIMSDAAGEAEAEAEEEKTAAGVNQH